MRMLLAGILAFVISAVVGRFLIPALRAMKAGQSIKEIGPNWHMSKQGTPTMGGIMFMVACVAAVLVFGWRDMAGGDFSALFVLVLALLYGAIGFVDDYAKIKKKENTGLTAGWKFLLQLAVAIAFLALMRMENHLTPKPVHPLCQRVGEPALDRLPDLRGLRHGGVRQRGEPHRRPGRPGRVGDPAGGGVLRRAVRLVGQGGGGYLRRRPWPGASWVSWCIISIRPRCLWGTPAPCSWGARCAAWPLPWTHPSSSSPWASSTLWRP